MVSIYALVNPINDTIFYIGASNNPKLRLSQHILDSRNGQSFKNWNILIILSLGKEVEMDILHECEVKDVSFWEEFYIDLFKSYGLDINQMQVSTYSASFINGYYNKNKEYKSRNVIINPNIYNALNVISDELWVSKRTFINLAIREKINRIIINDKNSKLKERLMECFPKAHEKVLIHYN